jgi:small GTP-binding protein
MKKMNFAKKKQNCKKEKKMLVSSQRINFIVIGNVQSGKTALIQRYTTNRFDQIYTPTIGVDFDSKTYASGLKVQIWDTSGQDKKSVQIWSKSADIAICIFTSVGATMEWIHELKKFATENLLIALVLTKKDRVSAMNKTAYQLSKQLNCLYFEVSALTGMGIENLFERCIETKLQKHETSLVDNISSSLLPIKEKEKCCDLL